MKRHSNLYFDGRLSHPVSGAGGQFIRQLQGLAVLTGTSHWQTGVKFEPHSIPPYVERGRRARSKVFVGTIKHLGGTLTKIFRNLVASISERRRTRQVVKELSSLSARVLEDIGITGHDIAALAEGNVTVEQINTRRHSHILRKIRLVPCPSNSPGSGQTENASEQHPSLDKAA